MSSEPVNRLICGDNLKALDDLIKEGIKVDLIYLDPPFFSNRHYEVIWGDEAEVRSFKDRWEGGINVYIEWMRERVSKMYQVLKDTGSFYLHCDWHASHYLKVMLDEIFGYRNFKNEIVWCYETAGKSKRHFSRKHDVIFFYTVGDNWIFNASAVSIPRKRGKHMRIGIDQDGREYEEKKDRRTEKVYRWYFDEGRLPFDYWTDIPFINREEAQRLGYPTQKPELLLERIIKASSNEGDIILDPFCGCGSCNVVAQRLGRKWIGIDISPTAITLITKRLEKIGAIKNKYFDIVGMPTTLSELKALEPFEFQNWVINEMKAKQSKKLTSDYGLDGYYDKTIFTERAGIQVKQSENIGRNIVDNFETALTRGKFKKGFIVAFGFTKGAYEEVARIRGDLDISLIKIEDLLLGKVKI
jgi:DNA modification methylase